MIVNVKQIVADYFFLTPGLYCSFPCIYVYVCIYSIVCVFKYIFHFALRYAYKFMTVFIYVYIIGRGDIYLLITDSAGLLSYAL